MRTLLLLASIAAAMPAPAQTPSGPNPGAAPAAPARPPAQTGRTTLVIQATTPRGLGLADIAVTLTGPVQREGATDASGSIRFLGLRAGTYRARFEGESVVTLEKDITITNARTVEVDATLSDAPPKPEPPPPPPPPEPPPPPPAPVVGPAGTPQATDLLTRAKLPKGQTRLETLLSCSGNTRSTLLQLAEDQPSRIYEGAEVVLYVLTGEAGITLGSQEGVLGPGGFVSVPRSTPFAFRRRGGKVLEALVVLAGEPCEAAR